MVVGSDILARLGRYFLPDQPLHVIQRGNNRQAIFFGDVDYAQFRTFLVEAADAYGCAIHAYVLMTNHVHLLVTPTYADSLARLMQSMGRRYVRYFNTKYQRSGTLWEGRFKGQDGAISGGISVVELSHAYLRRAQQSHYQARLVSGFRCYQ